MRMLDRLSMAYGIEVRMPFITRSLIEAGLNMPSEYYFHNGYTKGIVREAFKKDMNDEVRLAVKRNIQAPQSIYLKSKIMKEYIYDMINSDAFKSRGIFRSDQCNKLFKKFLKGEFENSFFIWQWIIIEEWHEIFIDNNATLKKYYIQDYV